MPFDLLVRVLAALEGYTRWQVIDALRRRPESVAEIHRVLNSPSHSSAPRPCRARPSRRRWRSYCGPGWSNDGSRGDATFTSWIEPAWTRCATTWKAWWGFPGSMPSRGAPQRSWHSSGDDRFALVLSGASQRLHRRSNRGRAPLARHQHEPVGLIEVSRVGAGEEDSARGMAVAGGDNRAAGLRYQARRAGWGWQRCWILLRWMRYSVSHLPSGVGGAACLDQGVCGMLSFLLGTRPRWVRR